MLKSFGLVVVAAGGVPARATANEADPEKRAPVQAVRFQVHPDNTGKVYVFAGGDNFSGDHRSDGLGLVAVLAAPLDPDTGPLEAFDWGMPNVAVAMNVNDLWVDVQQNGDGVIVSGLV